MAFAADWPRDQKTGQMLSKDKIAELGLPMPSQSQPVSRSKVRKAPVRRVGEVTVSDDRVFAEGFPKRLWNLDYPGETIADRRTFGPKDDPATATEYQFIDGVLTVFTQAEYEAVKAICGPRVVDEDLPADAEPFRCEHCGKATRSSRFFKKHLAKHP
jgi:hypothetical protein